MKKLIGLFAVLFITTNVFGQKFFRDFSFIETTPSGYNTIEDDIRDTVVFAGFYKYVVHFEANNRVFLLSYEPEQGNYRDIYLYSKDISDRNSPWEKASDIVTTSNWIDSYNYNEFDFYIYNENIHNSSVGNVIVEDDCVKLTIGYELMYNWTALRDSLGRASIPITFEFTPIGDNFYKCDGGSRIQ